MTGLSALPASAQGTEGFVAGQVLSASGTAVVGATVTVRQRGYRTAQGRGLMRNLGDRVTLDLALLRYRPLRWRPSMCAPTAKASARSASGAARW